MSAPLCAILPQKQPSFLFVNCIQLCLNPAIEGSAVPLRALPRPSLRETRWTLEALVIRREEEVMNRNRHALGKRVDPGWTVDVSVRLLKLWASRADPRSSRAAELRHPRQILGRGPDPAGMANAHGVVYTSRVRSGKAYQTFKAPAIRKRADRCDALEDQSFVQGREQEPYLHEATNGRLCARLRAGGFSPAHRFSRSFGVMLRSTAKVWRQTPPPTR